jgi:predicted RNase H-like HicB family nuclease
MLRFKAQDARDADPGGSTVLTQGLDCRAHSLAKTKAVTIEMEHDEATDSFITYVKELHRMSTFGDTARDALDKTAEMIRGYIESMEERGMKIPLAKAKLAELKQLVGL